MKNTLRAFVAFKLPDHIIDRAAALQGALKARGLKLKWVKSQNLHLTMKFLGDIPEPDAPKVGEAMKRAVMDEAPLDLTLQGMGVFPGIKRPRVLWLGLGGQLESLKRAHRKLEDELDKSGFGRDKRGFKAHLTIARFKKAVVPKQLLDGVTAVGDFEPEPFEARKLVLYKSDLQPNGAVYTPLAAVALG